MLQEAELSIKLIQRTTSEAPHRLCTSLDWMFTRSPATGRGPDKDVRNTVRRSYVCWRGSGSHGPRSSVVFLSPSRSLGLRVAYESVMTFAEDRSDLD